MDQTDPARDPDPLRRLAEAALARQEAARRQRADDQAAVDRDHAAQAQAADHAQTLAEAQQLAAEVFGAEGAELAAGLTWTAVGTGQATATIDEHVLVYHRTPIVWTRARAANSPLGQSWWPTADGTRPPQHRRLGPSLGLRRRCGCGQQLGYGPFTSLAEAGQVLRRTDSCGSWNPWDTNYPHQGPMKETANEPHRSVRPRWRWTAQG
jgi:hypothetical protein